MLVYAITDTKNGTAVIVLIFKLPQIFALTARGMSYVGREIDRSERGGLSGGDMCEGELSCTLAG